MSDLCTATTKAGHPCQKAPMKGRDVCKQHSGDPDVGRPGKLTEDVIHRVSQALRSGNFVEPACLFAGISVSAYYLWRERGEADLENGTRSPHVEFLEATTRAIAEGEMAAVARLMQNVQNGDQKAIEFYLERRHSDRWSRRERTSLEHSGRIQTDTVEVPSDRERIDEVTRILRQTGIVDTEAA